MIVDIKVFKELVHLGDLTNPQIIFRQCPYSYLKGHLHPVPKYPQLLGSDLFQNVCAWEIKIKWSNLGEQLRCG